LCQKDDQQPQDFKQIVNTEKPGQNLPHSADASRQKSFNSVRVIVHNFCLFLLFTFGRHVLVAAMVLFELVKNMKFKTISISIVTSA
jgi:hypothetical protein